jgi:hypothetical protein
MIAGPPRYIDDVRRLTDYFRELRMAPRTAATPNERAPGWLPPPRSPVSPVMPTAAFTSTVGSGRAGGSEPTAEIPFPLLPPSDTADGPRKHHRVHFTITVGVAAIALVATLLGVTVPGGRSHHPGEGSIGAPAPGSTALSSPSTTTKNDSEEAAQAQLDAWVTSDRATANGLVEQWVPQIGAKRKGLVVGTRTFTLQLVVQDHASYRGRYVGTILIPGSAFEGFKFAPGETWYVTLVATAFPDGEGALKWCRDQGLGRDDCFARLITHRRDIKTSMFNS